MGTARSKEADIDTGIGAKSNRLWNYSRSSWGLNVRLWVGAMWSRETAAVWIEIEENESIRGGKYWHSWICNYK